jgi:hypothetical protein
MYACPVCGHLTLAVDATRTVRLRIVTRPRAQDTVTFEEDEGPLTMEDTTPIVCVACQATCTVAEAAAACAARYPTSSPDIPEYDYAELLARLDILPTFRVRYADDETGWAYRLDPDVVCLSNMPVTEGFLLYDIAWITKDTDDWYMLAGVIQRYFTQQYVVRYLPAHDVDNEATAKHRWPLLVEACTAVKCCVEEGMPGYAIVHAPDGVDVPTVLHGLGWDDCEVREVDED